MALSDDAGKVQLVPGSSSSPPELDKTSGIQIVENPSDSVYRKTCHQVLFFSFFLLFIVYPFFFLFGFRENVGISAKSVFDR